MFCNQILMASIIIMYSEIFLIVQSKRYETQKRTQAQEPVPIPKILCPAHIKNSAS